MLPSSRNGHGVMTTSNMKWAEMAGPNYQVSRQNSVIKRHMERQQSLLLRGMPRVKDILLGVTGFIKIGIETSF